MPESRLLIQRKINRSLRSEIDFTEAESYAQRITQSPDDIVKRAMLTATIICYARPFSRNELSSAAEASPKHTLEEHEGLTAQESALHNLIIHLRNKVVAHAEHEINPATWSSGAEAGFSYHAREYDLAKGLPDASEIERLCRKRKKQSMDLSFELNLQLVALQNAL